jgi:hypothetical protein
MRKTATENILERLHEVKPEMYSHYLYIRQQQAPKGVMDTNQGLLMNLREYTKFFSPGQ